jgi:hypothetical protein
MALEQFPVAALQLAPDLADLVKGLVLTNLAIGLQGHNQTNPIGKLFKILVERQPLR